MHKIKQTIDLIKKTKDHPILFHILYSNLCHLKKNERTFFQHSNDLFTNILYVSTDESKSNNFNLETKILKYLKESRKEYNPLKIRIILYYLEGRLVNKINSFILFELINYHYKKNCFNDLLIEQILSKTLVCDLFGIKNSKKIQNDAISLFLNQNTNFSLRRLPIYYSFDILPPYVNYENESNSFLLDVKVVEMVAFYAKYTKNVEFFKKIIPQTEEFLILFKSFISNDFKTEKNKKNFCIKKLVSSENEEKKFIYERIKELINKENDKNKLKNELISFIETLE